MDPKTLKPKAAEDWKLVHESNLNQQQIAQNKVQTQEQEAAEEPQPASGGARKGGGKAYYDTAKNDARTAQGKPPIGKDGHPVELHSPEQTHKDQSQEMTRTDKRLNGNFTKNPQK